MNILKMELNITDGACINEWILLRQRCTWDNQGCAFTKRTDHAIKGRVDITADYTCFVQKRNTWRQIVQKH